MEEDIIFLIIALPFILTLLYFGFLFIVAFFTAERIKHKCRKANCCKLAPRCENEKEMLCYEEEK